MNFFQVEIVRGRRTLYLRDMRARSGGYVVSWTEAQVEARSMSKLAAEDLVAKLAKCRVTSRVIPASRVDV